MPRYRPRASGATGSALMRRCPSFCGMRSRRWRARNPASPLLHPILARAPCLSRRRQGAIRPRHRSKISVAKRPSPPGSPHLAEITLRLALRRVALERLWRARDHQVLQGTTVEERRRVLEHRVRLAAIGGDHHDHATLPRRERVRPEHGSVQRLERSDARIAASPPHDEVGFLEWLRGGDTAASVATEYLGSLLSHGEAIDGGERYTPRVPAWVFERLKTVENTRAETGWSRSQRSSLGALLADGGDQLGR